MSELYQLPDDIRAEFYLTTDGGIRAKSWAAVARLAGVRKSTILERLLPRIFKSTETLPKTLQPLAGKDLRQSPEIDETTISCVVNYYAWESEMGKNDTAKEVALIFNAIGIRSFFQKELGWNDPKVGELAEIKLMLGQMMAKLIQVEADLAVFKNAGTQFPGITNIVNNNTNILVLPANFKEPFSIREWVLVTQGRNLTSGECKSIGRMAAATMTTLKLESPLKYGTAKVYKYRDMPALQTIWKSWLLSTGNNA